MPPKRLSPIAQIKEIENDEQYKNLVAQLLPPNYDFEIAKTVWRIRKGNCSTVALQFPEGLLIFSTKIGRILTQLTGVDVVLMGDITYGACCVDDHTAAMLGADLLVHYGHSCLVPVAVANKLDTIYVFVSIKYNLPLAVQSISSLIREKTSSKKIESNFTVVLVSTIQFAGSLGELKKQLDQQLDRVDVVVPRTKPLSGGEILGCTAPKIQTHRADLILYVGDGRFHLEAMMMANPEVQAYRYDPYNTTLTCETFDHAALAKNRVASLRSLEPNKRVGVILGTLGRQGNPAPMNHVYDLLKRRFKPFVILMSEIMPAKLQLLETVSGFVQFACPRLSIDWGNAFHVPVLTSYEATLVVVKNEMESYSHPMDYYAYDSCGPHTPNHVCSC